MIKTYVKELVFLVLYCLVIAPLLGQNESVGSEHIFPPQGQHVHGSSIVELSNGDLLACWFQGSGERTANDVLIKGARLKKGESNWSDTFVLADTPNHPDCNPVLFIDANQKLYLYWIVVQAASWESSILKYRTSSDYLKGGAPNWDWQEIILLKPDSEFENTIEEKFKSMEPRNLTWAAYAPQYEKMIYEAAKEPKKKETGWMTRIHPTVLANGRIILPLYSDGFNMSLVGISDDQGKTWSPSLPIVGYGNIQPSVVQKEDGSLVAFMRDNGDAPGRVVVSTSEDMGFSWSAAEKSEIPNSGASIETIKLENGDWIMVYNDTEEGRHSLAVSLSSDEGKTWPWKKHLEKDETKIGSFSYPSMIQSKDGRIQITYSHHIKKSRTIKHVAFPSEWIKDE